jgi:hypothetical protein
VSVASHVAVQHRTGRELLTVWPATLKDQALAFYRASRAVDAAAAASRAGWLVEPRPHLAFFRASVGQRLYLTPGVDALTYARQLTEGDVERVGGWPVEALESDLLPWLVDRGYGAPGDLAGLARFGPLAAARGGAHLRMAMRFSHECDPDDDAQIARLTADVLDLLGENEKSPPERALRRSG